MKKKNICLLIICSIILLMNACTMPQTKIYSINMNYPFTEKDFKGKFSEKLVMIVVNAPRHLSQPYIVYRTSPYEMEISKYSKWEASPQEIIKKVMKDYISSLKIFKEVKTSYTSQEGYYTLEIDLKRFERFDSENISYGELLFDYVLISPEGNEIERSRINKKIELQEKSFLSLAKILSNALHEACVETGDKLSK
ncbi:MAG: membrane integrity-associated transporter subunit PqiC [Nitrospirae bacterium]|nr:membrane integrity-associated transporter subunit PqiC [Nitrospirota bacterium]